MSTERELAGIYDNLDDIRQSIHKLNENLLMIAYQIYSSNGGNFYTIENFLSDLKYIQKEVKNESN